MQIWPHTDQEWRDFYRALRRFRREWRLVREAWKQRDRKAG